MSAVKKIVIIGPESTGKSTLSAQLASALHTVWAPEYARAYIESLARPYTEPDLLQIATGQIQAEEEAMLQARDVLICDTDLYVLKVWSEHSYDRCHHRILEQIATRRYDAYILTDIDLPWQPDSQREHPHLRHYFYDQYRDIVANSGLPWITVSGSEQTRLQIARSFIHTELLTAHPLPLTN